MKRRALFALIMGSVFSSGLVAQWRRRRQQREWADVLTRMQTRGQAQIRAMLQAEGRDPDRMSEDEMEDVTDYVDRVIHEYRAEQRENERQAYPTA